MTNILPPNLYGVDVALNRLRPGASYQLSGTKFTEWNDPSGKPAPQWAEVLEQIEKDKAEAEAISLAHKAVLQPVAELVESVSGLPHPDRMAPNPDGPQDVREQFGQ